MHHQAPDSPVRRDIAAAGMERPAGAWPAPAVRTRHVGARPHRGL